MRRRWMQHARGSAGLVALAGLVGLGTGAELAVPEPLSLPALPEPESVPSVHVLTVPDQARPLTAAEQLEQRLAALAQDVERRRAQGPVPGLVEFDVEGLADRLGHMFERYADRASLSVHVRDLQTGHVLFDWFGDTPLIPASNQKLVTSSAALHLLGADYVWHTRVLRHGPTLYLVGEGDPLLQVDDLRALAERTAAEVDAAELERLVIDDSVFSPRRFGPGYDPEGPGWSYEAPSGALSVQWNTIDIAILPGRSRPHVYVSPQAAHVRVDNRARTGRGNTLQVSTLAEGEHTVVRVSGRLARSHAAVFLRRRITDPGLHAGSVFAALLAEHTASEPLEVQRGSVPPEAELMVEHPSRSLLEVLDDGLAYSNNFVAEQILRTLAYRMTGDPGDWEAGQQILHDYWAALTGPQPALVVENASGLSRNGRLTTHGLVDLIAIAHRTAAPAGNLIDALPVAGEPGTLRSRLRLSGKRVRAKTGTLDGVSGLSGVIASEAGVPMVGFGILINSEPHASLVADARRGLEDRIVMEVLRALDDYEAQRSGLQPPRGDGDEPEQGDLDHS